MKTATVGQPVRQPSDNQQTAWQPPRGIRYSYRAERSGAPFFLHWREGKARHAAAYDSEHAREKAAKALAEKRTEHGAEVLTFNPKEWRAWLAFKEIIGSADPLRIAHEWKAGNQRAARFSTTTIAEVSDRYLKAREADGIAKGTLCHAKLDMARFVTQFGTRTLDLTPTEIRTWLTALPFGDVTKRNHYKRVRAFYAWARMENLATINPCEAIRSPARDVDDVSVLSVTDAAKLFRTAKKLRPQVCARLALEAFAGLRFSSAARLVKTDVNFADEGITLPAAKIKTRRRHYIDGLPVNLWDWLRGAPPEAWTLTERQYLSMKSEAFILAGITNPGNVLRHSFCSYHVAANKDAARTAVILCHSSPSMIYQHYKGRATESDAKRFFSITPRGMGALPTG